MAVRLPVNITARFDIKRPPDYFSLIGGCPVKMALKDFEKQVELLLKQISAGHTIGRGRKIFITDGHSQITLSVEAKAKTLTKKLRKARQVTLRRNRRSIFPRSPA
jgi:hypothetical protein